MSHFDHHTLHHLKKLCRIDCSPEEETELLQSIGKILEYVAQLKEVNTEGVKSCHYVLRGMLKNQMREDQVFAMMSREQFLANAPDQIGGMIRTPLVLKPPQ